MPKNKLVKIENRQIGDGQPCFVIAEAGANFRISRDPKVNFKQALRLIDIAVEAKADAVKFQLYRANKLYVKKAGTADYIGKKKSIYDIIREMELPYEWLPKLKKYCIAKGIIFMCSPFDEEAVDELERRGISSYKIASYSITHEPLLRYIASKGKPIILSTGASTIGEIKRALHVIRNKRDVQICLMQCTAKYPAPIETINLKVIPTLKKIFGLPVGLSDHARDHLIPPLGAVALGANLVEKHYTTDNSLPGPDHGFAILPHELKQMVKGIRDLEKTLGDDRKVILKEEKELYDFAREYVFAKKNISKGKKFSMENLIVLRKGKMKKGLQPKYFEALIGKTASIKILSNQPITKMCVKEKF
ncbi:MAG: N-acetylneuraminate synthase [archaeon GW2011_AR3]|nr:MAG: N-acetylneuraminate synthase [archaeon GW2011_AR3]